MLPMRLLHEMVVVKAFVHLCSSGLLIKGISSLRMRDKTEGSDVILNQLLQKNLSRCLLTFGGCPLSDRTSRGVCVGRFRFN